METNLLINADTAIVGNNCFIHYCHSLKTLVALRIHREACPFCKQKNPDYTPNKGAFAVIDFKTGAVVMGFEDDKEAIQYIQNHPYDNLALSDTGFVLKKASVT